MICHFLTAKLPCCAIWPMECLNKEIAELTFMSNKTISAHKANIFSKLGLHSIVELIDYAKSHELL